MAKKDGFPISEQLAIAGNLILPKSLKNLLFETGRKISDVQKIKWQNETRKRLSNGNIDKGLYGLTINF